MVGALRSDELETTHLCCCAAKYADTFFQERDVTILIGDLRAQPGQLGPLARRQVPIGRHCARAGSSPVPDTFCSNPSPQKVLMQIQLPADLGNRPAAIHHPPSGLHLELRRKRPTSPGHTHILPAGPRAPLSRVSTETGEAQATALPCAVAVRWENRTYDVRAAISHLAVESW